MGLADAALAITVHVAAMLAVTAVIALLVYDKLGSAFLRKAWINSDQFWAAAFIFAGAATLVT